jgi:hypothetical protein
MKKILIPIILVVVLLGAGGVFLYARSQQTHPASQMANQQSQTQPSPQTKALATQPLASSTPSTSTPTLGTPVVSPSIITVNTSTPVTVTVQIANPSPIPGSVNLLLLGATGTQPSIRGVMQNSGNGNYSLQSVFDPSSTGQLQVEVSAAFQGQIRRLVSNISAISVWQRFNDPTTGIAFSLPQFAPVETISSTPATPSAAASLQVNVVDPVDTQYVITLMTFVVQSNSQHLSFQNWFEQNVDYNGLLLSAGNIQSQQLPNSTVSLKTKQC